MHGGHYNDSTAPEEPSSFPDLTSSGLCLAMVNSSNTDDSKYFIPSSPTNTFSTNEISIYCQNFNRMRSAAKINEIQIKILASSYTVILGTVGMRALIVKKFSAVSTMSIEMTEITNGRKKSLEVEP